MTEAEYQKKVTDKIKKLLPGCDVLKNNSAYIQGIPDWSVIYGGKHAYLEIKIEEKAHRQPNQGYYIDKANYSGGFGRFVYPENEKEVLNDMINYFNN